MKLSKTNVLLQTIRMFVTNKHYTLSVYTVYSPLNIKFRCSNGSLVGDSRGKTDFRFYAFLFRCPTWSAKSVGLDVHSPSVFAQLCLHSNERRGLRGKLRQFFPDANKTLLYNNDLLYLWCLTCTECIIFQTNNYR